MKRYILNTPNGYRVPATLKQVLDKRPYIVRTENGAEYRRNRQHILVGPNPTVGGNTYWAKDCNFEPTRNESYSHSKNKGRNFSRRGSFRQRI